MTTYDVAIAGLGVIGSATAYELARRGLSVIGFDRYHPPHPYGSSHGDTRIIREAYFEDPVYVPMVQRSFELWRALESTAATPLLHETCGLMIGAPRCALVEGALRSAELHGLRHSILLANEIRARFPMLTAEPGMIGVLEPRAGVLRAEACVSALVDQSQRSGAVLRFDEPVVQWQSQGGGISVFTAQGEYQARQFVVSAGAWVASLLPGLNLPFTVERQVFYWFEPEHNRDLFTPKRCPVHLWQYDGDRFFYGLPDQGAGIKLAFHHGGETTTADTVQRDVSVAEVEEVREAIRRFVPGADGALRASVVCLYTNTPDEHFLIDRHPDSARVLVASPCSGHGFKFAPIVGEIVADLIERRSPKFDLSRFRWR
jgi:sarcosine oxidase